MQISTPRTTVTPRVIGPAITRPPAFAGLTREEIAARVAADLKTARKRLHQRDGAGRWGVSNNANAAASITANVKFLAAIEGGPASTGDIAQRLSMAHGSVVNRALNLTRIDCIEVEWIGKRVRLYTITDDGRAYLAQHSQAEAAQ